MNKRLKVYTAYSESYGKEEGAFLVFAPNSRIAKKMAWKETPIDFVGWTDLRIRLIRTPGCLPLVDQDKLTDQIPHVIVDPVSCQSCKVWGAGITEDYLCGNCNRPPGQELLNLFRQGA